MPGKTFFNGIASLQQALLALSIIVLVMLPPVIAYGSLSGSVTSFLFMVSLTAVFLVMSIRPLADLTASAWIRPLVILRKGFGVFSASIIVSFMLASVLAEGAAYATHFFSAAHWSVSTLAVLSPLGDLSALVLLITSNQFSKRVLGSWWKRVQKLAYVYFYAGALYEWLLLGQGFAFWYLLIVTVLVLLAFVKKRFARATTL